LKEKKKVVGKKNWSKKLFYDEIEREIEREIKNKKGVTPKIFERKKNKN
tara:strand:- start:358 stop:504 length:147 start_codon:yes stop_codon:yes gene_type:complete